MIIICVVILLIVVAVIFALVFAVATACNKKNIYGGRIANVNTFTDLDKNAKNDPSGWQLYLSTTCGHCIEQKKILNDFNTYAEYNHHRQLITNNIKGKLYPIEKIKGFPFWYNTKTKATKLGKIDNLCELSPKIKNC
jgi:hypothetical protein